MPVEGAVVRCPVSYGRACGLPLKVVPDTEIKGM